MKPLLSIETLASSWGIQNAAFSVTLSAEFVAPDWPKVVEAPTPRCMVLLIYALVPANSVP